MSRPCGTSARQKGQSLWNTPLLTTSRGHGSATGHLATGQTRNRAKGRSFSITRFSARTSGFRWEIYLPIRLLITYLVLPNVIDNLQNTGGRSESVSDDYDYGCMKLYNKQHAL